MINLRRVLRIPYVLESHSEGRGPVILFLHGIASSSGNWRQLVPLLTDNFRCITIDLLGFGDSPKPDWSSYTMNEHVRSIRRTIKKLHLQEDYVLVGHSLGSLLACRYASLYPSEIRQLVMLSPPVYLQSSQLSNPLARSAASGYALLYKFLRANKRFTLRNASLIAKLLPTETLSLGEDTWVPFMRTLENCIETQTILTDIADVKSPVDVFYGRLDQFIVQRNLKILASMRHVEVHELRAGDHVIRSSYAKKVAAFLRASLPAATTSATTSTSREAATPRPR